MNWTQLQDHKPPFVPKLQDETDAAYFDEIEEDQHIIDVEEDIEQSGYSTAAANTNRVFGYTFNRADGQQFQQYQKRAKEAQMRVDQANAGKK